MEKLSQLIDNLNQRYGLNLNDADKVDFANYHGPPRAAATTLAGRPCVSGLRQTRVIREVRPGRHDPGHEPV